MCVYERKYGCLNCPLPDCMANGRGDLAKKFQKQPKKKESKSYNRKLAVFRKMGMDV